MPISRLLRRGLSGIGQLRGPANSTARSSRACSGSSASAARNIRECSPGRTWKRPARGSSRGPLEEAERQLRTGRPDQPAIHVRHDRPSQGRLAQPPQPAAERLLCGRAVSGSTARDRICIPVPLYHCFGCVLGTMCAAVSGAAMVFPHESFDAEATLGGRRSRALHGDLRRADHVHRRVGTSRLSATAILRRCGRASWRAALARSRS